MIATRDAGGRYTECRSGSIASSFADPAQSSERVPNCACPAEMRLHSGSLGRNGPERVAGGCLLFSAWSTVLSGRHRLQVCLPTAAPLHWKLLQNISRCAWVPYQLPACLPACLLLALALALTLALALAKDSDPDPMLASTTTPGSPLHQSYSEIGPRREGGGEERVFVASRLFLRIIYYSNLIAYGPPGFFPSVDLLR